MPSRLNTEVARELRQNMTGVELLLWARLRGRQVAGFKFRRQAPIGPYIVDFVCLSARLVVEVDGPSHDFTAEWDVTRDAWLAERGYTVLRFTADEVLSELESVVAGIAHVVVNRPTAPPSASPPPAGRRFG